MPRLSVLMIRTALIYLGIGFTLGGLVLFNKGIPIGADIPRLMLPHGDILLFGWVMQLIMGTAFWIMPRFPMPPKYGRVWLAQAAYLLLNAGIIASVIGQWGIQTGLTFVGRVLMLLAVLCFAAHIMPRVRPYPET